MSVLRDIYRFVAGTSVSFASPTQAEIVQPAVRDLDTLRNSEASAELPLRLLLPVSQLDGNAFAFPTYCGSAELTWNITDLLLWRALAQGFGLTDAAEDLVLYAAAYADAVLTMRDGLPESLDTISITNARIQPGVFEFPKGSGVRYLGVECTLMFTERLEQ
jgi:hypothetical protein